MQCTYNHKPISNKMKKKTIYRTVIEIEILSEEPIPEGLDLEEIEGECQDGEYSGKHELKVSNQKLVGIKAANATRAQGSSPDFFMMDEEGNELNSENEEE